MAIKKETVHSAWAWLDPRTYSSATYTWLKTLLAFAFLTAATGGLGLLLGGLEGLYLGILFNSALSLSVLWFSREIVFWLYSVKEVKPNQLEEGFDLHELVEELQHLPKVGLRTKPTIGIMETNVLNAFATGRHQGHAGIAVTRGLLKQARKYVAENQIPFTAEELVKAILLHELGHLLHRDIVINTTAGILAASVKMMSDKLYEKTFHAQNRAGERGSEENNRGFFAKYGTVFIFLMGWLAPLAVKLTTLLISRKREEGADKTAHDNGYGGPLMHGLKMLKDRAYRADNDSSTEADIFKQVEKFEGLSPTLLCHNHCSLNEEQATSDENLSFFGSAWRNFQRITSTHPLIEDRIAHLEELEREEEKARNTHSCCA